MEHWKLAEPKETEEIEEPEELSARVDAPSTSWLDEPTVVPVTRATRQPQQRSARGGAARGPQDTANSAVERWVRVAWKPATYCEAQVSALEWWRQHVGCRSCP